MAAIKNLSQSSDKWVRRSSVAGPDYQSGVESPRRDWAEASLAAEESYKTGVAQAAQQGRYGKGVKAAGSETWQEAAIQKGPGRFAEGVSLAKDDWQEGFSPYQAAIAALKLPDRGPAGDPKNLQRVAAVATALRQLALKG